MRLVPTAGAGELKGVVVLTMDSIQPHEGQTFSIEHHCLFLERPNCVAHKMEVVASVAMSLFLFFFAVGERIGPVTFFLLCKVANYSGGDMQSWFGWVAT